VLRLPIAISSLDDQGAGEWNRAIFSPPSWHLAGKGKNIAKFDSSVLNPNLSPWGETTFLEIPCCESMGEIDKYG
jgi:hypothetical protein